MDFFTARAPARLNAVFDRFGALALAVVMFLLGTRLTGLSPRLAGWSPTLPMGLGGKLGLADGRATVWTCDLTHGYIAINADYRS